MQDPLGTDPIASHGAQSLAAEALAIMNEEANAILRTARELNESQLEAALDILVNGRGKVVLIGSGKSGIAARKIAGTLTSTGTAAVFLHPTDALHGDLGIITPEDVAIVVSHSGETDEIGAILPHLKRRRVPLIAITGNAKSTLASQADAVLDASVEREAGAFDLAPTSSTTIAIVIGDALAMCLMRMKNFTVEEFASLHPAGRLGKRLTLRVADLMHSGGDNPTVGETATWMEVLESITRGGLGAVNVVDANGGLRGLITDGDVRRAAQRLGVAGLESADASGLMTRDPTVVSGEILAYEALRLMEDRPSQISVVPVVDGEGSSIGLLRLHDIVRAGLR